jgi:(p)ppGpp synthase/HD superfamily hydrolase
VGVDGPDQARLTRAAQLALSWHADQPRKGSEIPYASHLLQVAGLVLEHGGDIDQAVAGFLHDSLEDVISPEERRAREETLRDEFGEGVLSMVRACTDTEEHEALGNKAPWKERKTRYLGHLAHVDLRSALVTACDKRHNLGALVGDVRAHGVQYLDRFHAGASDQVWYFDGVVEALRDRIPRRLAEEFEAVLADFRTLVE